MGSKMEESKSDVVRIRFTPALRARCDSARNAGSWSGRTESDFLGYLVELGLVRYEKSFLPLERGDDLQPRSISTGPVELGKPELGVGKKENAG